MLNAAAVHRPSDATYRCGPDVAYAVESTGIVLMGEPDGPVRHLGYPEAAVWDLISRRYTFDRTVAMLRAIASLDACEAEHVVRRCLREWTDAGFLVRHDAHG